MTKRSYFTTPLFVMTTIISLVVFVEYNAEQYNIVNTYENTFLETTHRNYSFIKKVEEYRTRTNAGHIATPDSVRAIYISSWVAGTPSLINKLIDFVTESDINAVVIDIKDSTGVISFPTDIPLVQKYSTDSTRIRDINSLIERLHDNNIYVIGRLTTFQDPLLSKKNPDWSFKRIDNNEVWTDRKGLAFINPNKEAAWDYIADIAEYSYAIGFDEINFDYIRYPSDGSIHNINYEIAEGESRATTMKSFYEYIDNRLRSKGIPISADIFGLVTTAQDDIGIGQVFEDIYPHFDAIAPMVYPSHYSSGFFGYTNPNAHPYEVVRAAMQGAIDKAHSIDEDPDKLRTWIQDFNLGTPTYGINEVKAQINATYDISLDSYMSWDPKNRYTKEAYK